MNTYTNRRSMCNPRTNRFCGASLSVPKLGHIRLGIVLLWSLISSVRKITEKANRARRSMAIGMWPWPAIQWRAMSVKYVSGEM